MSYLVLSSQSHGYKLYSFSDKSISFNCHRGKLSYLEKSIIIGDEVILDDKGFISSIKERKNLLKRPRLANCDIVYVLISAKQPDFSSYLLDKFLTMVNFSSIEARIIVTKADLLSKEEFVKLKNRLSDYQKINYDVYFINCNDKESFDFKKLEDSLSNKKIAFIGQTGVGKSSLINALDSSYKRKVDSLYVEIGRGRHTTKEVVLLPFKDGFLFDTPGFSSFDLVDMDRHDLSICFPGYKNYVSKCYFKDCLHEKNSKGCCLIDDLGKRLSFESYENYLKISLEVKENEKWKKKI